MAAGGYDLAASFSGSASATSGLRTDNSYRYGDVILGAPGAAKPAPFWVWLVMGVLVLAAGTVWLVRR